MRMKMSDGVYSREEYIVFSSTSHPGGEAIQHELMRLVPSPSSLHPSIPR